MSRLIRLPEGALQDLDIEELNKLKKAQRDKQTNGHGLTVTNREESRERRLSGRTCAVGGRAGPGAVGGAVSRGKARGLVALPARVRDRAGEEHPVAEDDPGEGRGPRVTTGHS